MQDLTSRNCHCKDVKAVASHQRSHQRCLMFISCLLSTSKRSIKKLASLVFITKYSQNEGKQICQGAHVLAIFFSLLPFFLPSSRHHWLTAGSLGGDSSGNALVLFAHPRTPLHNIEAFHQIRRSHWFPRVTPRLCSASR